MEWIEELFIDKGELYLRVLNKMWKKADREAMNIKRLLESLNVHEGSLLLDLGCGNGRIAVNLAKLGYRIIGVDISPLFVRDAEEKAKINGVDGKALFRVGDARRIDEELDEIHFDAVLMYWTTILGYYDKATDADILKRVRRVTKNGGYLLILNTASLDLTILRAGISGSDTSYLEEVDEDLVIVEKPSFDPLKAALSMRWTFYRRKGRDLEYIDEIMLKLRIYGLHELIELAEDNGWQFVNAYKDLETLSSYKPLLSGLNVVFKAK